jgi:Cu+-exporting ATPase
MNEAHEHLHAHGNSVPAASGTMIDPVCGMTVKPDSDHVFEHAGQTYRFCSAKCQAKFAAEPQRYLQAATEPAATVAIAGTIYTCPMHPEIRQPIARHLPQVRHGAGAGAAGAGRQAENPELADFRRRFWWTLPLTRGGDPPRHGRTPPGSAARRRKAEPGSS